MNDNEQDDAKATGQPGPTSEAELLNLADQVLDDAAIDWKMVARGSAASFVEEFQALEKLVHLSRQPSEDAPASRTPEPTALGDWGHLRLLERVGEGTYGEVFRAWDPRLDRLVALKLLRCTDGAAAHGSAAINEGRLLARIKHPNVVTVFGAERIQDRVGIWTEFVHGSTLAAIVEQQGPLDAATAIGIGRDLCQALAALHAAGVVHGDIKAQNVLREAGGRVVLVDLGTGREHLGDSAGAGPVYGTPLYMAPELWMRMAPTPESDVYSLGVLLHFLVTGTYPVRGATGDEVREAHEAGRRAPLRAARPGLPASFIESVEAALDSNPVRRPTSASLDAALQRIDRPARTAGRMTILTIAAFLVLLLPGWFVYRSTSLTQPHRAVIALPVILSNASLPIIDAAAGSPDGKYLAYADSRGLQVRTNSTGEERAVTLPETAKITSIDWVDSAALLVATADRIWRVSRASGAVEKLADGGGFIAAAPDGKRVAVTDARQEGIRLLTADGQKLGDVIGPEKGQGLSRVSWSPDGQRMVFISGRFGPRGRVSAIETIRFDGSERQVVASGDGFRNPFWVRDRLLIPRMRSSLTPRSDDLWEVQLDGAGKARGEPARIWQSPHLVITQPHATLHGSEAVFVGREVLLQLSLADWDSASMRLTHVTILPVQPSAVAELDLSVSAWTPKGDSVLFRTSAGDVYQQALDSREASKFLDRPKTDLVQAVAGPGGSIFYTVSHLPALMRQAADGTTAALFSPGGQPWMRCARPATNACAIAVMRGTVRQLEVTPFDTVTGKQGVMVTLPGPPTVQGWDLSPDGRSIASVEVTSRSFRLWITDVKTHHRESVGSIEGSVGLGVTWSPLSRGWIVTRQRGTLGSEVLHVDGSGGAVVLWRDDYRALTQPMMSPDGRRVLFSSFSSRSSIYSLRGF